MKDTGIKLAQYTFMESYHKAMKSLVTNGDFSKYGRMMFTINDFALYGERPDIKDFDNVETTIWTLIEPILERTRMKATAGQTGGRKSRGGGAPIGNNNASKTTSKQQANNKQTTSKTTTDKDKDKDKEENKEETDISSFVSPSPAFIKFNDWIEKECPHVAKMEIQMTEKEFCTAIDLYGKPAIASTLRQMENWKPLLKKDRSVYRTLRNWLNRDQKSKKQ